MHSVFFVYIIGLKMSPNPRSRIKYTDDKSTSGLIVRLNLLLFFMVVQVVMTIGLWVEVASLKKSLHLEPQASVKTTEKLSEPDRTTRKPVDQEMAKSVASDVSSEKTVEKGVPIEEIESSPIRLQVLNGCGVAGIAGRVGKWLNRNAYDVVDIGNADRQDYRLSRIIDRSGNLTSARELADLLGLSEDHIKRSTLISKPEIDLTLIVGKDHKRLPIGR